MFDQILVQEYEGNDVDDAAGDNGQYGPDHGFAEIARHFPEHGQVQRRSLERGCQLLLHSSSPGLFPPEVDRGIKEFQAAGVVVPHPPDELIEDIEAVEAQREHRPAQCRPEIEDVVGVATLLHGQADADGCARDGQVRRGRRGATRPAQCTVTHGRVLPSTPLARRSPGRSSRMAGAPLSRRRTPPGRDQGADA